MAAIPGFVGRRVKFYQGDESTGTQIIARTKTMTIGNESIDVTSDNDDGFRTLLADPAQRSIDMSVEGVIRQDDFINSLLDPSATTELEDYTLVIPNIGSIVGNFRFSNVEIGANYNEATTFSSTVESSGSWTFTAEA